MGIELGSQRMTPSIITLDDKFVSFHLKKSNWDAHSWEQGPAVDMNRGISPEMIQQELRPAAVTTP